MWRPAGGGERWGASAQGGPGVLQPLLLCHVHRCLPTAVWFVHAICVCSRLLFDVVLNSVWLCVCAGDMSESKAHQVEIREVDGQTLRKLVDYIYTAEIEVTEDNVQVRVCATECSWTGGESVSTSPFWLPLFCCSFSKFNFSKREHLAARWSAFNCLAVRLLLRSTQAELLLLPAKHLGSHAVVMKETS